jgi:hypothetical protein
MWLIRVHQKWEREVDVARRATGAALRFPALVYGLQRTPNMLL